MNIELIKIRKIKEKDATGWYTLANKVWRDAYSHIFPEKVFIEKENKFEDYVKNFSNKIQNSNKDIGYVAKYEGNIIGIMCGSINSRYDFFPNEYAELIGIYIDPECQGYGVGKSFKKIFEDWARENGASKYIIGVLKDNEKARKVYEAWGGELSPIESSFTKLGVEYPEVFYIFNL